jgi:GNAT superfamily N-acetyltransferase
MTPARAKLWHMPRLLAVLWAYTWHTEWLPKKRPWWVDAQLMAKIILHGWVRHLRGRGFIVQDGVRIHALYVHPAARGRGIGQALLQQAKAESDRLELWVLLRNEAARAFYAAQGFDEVMCSIGMGNDENLPDILMVWERGERR